MEQIQTITKCIHQCPFFGTDNDGMYCGHPYFDGANPYDNMIITQDNWGEGNFPEKCPLRKESLYIKYHLK